MSPGVVHRLKAEGGLGRYHAVAATPGFPRAIAGVIAELRLARLPSDAIDSVAPDLVPLIGAYEAELAEAGLTDWPGVLALATEAASGWRQPASPDRPAHAVARRTVGSEAELAFVRALAAAAPEMLATVPAADEPTLRPDSRRTAFANRGSRRGAVERRTRRRGRHRRSREASAPALQRTCETIRSESGQRGRGVLRAGRGPRMRRDRPARALAGSTRNPVRPDRRAAAFTGGVPRPSRGGVHPSGHSGSLRTRRGATRPGRASLLCTAQVCSRRPVGAALRRVPVSWAGA